MKRLFSFIKIDLMRMRSMLWCFLLPLALVLIVLFRRRGEGEVLFAVGYALFIGIVLASTPFKTEAAGEQGLFRMLPAKPGEQVVAHFLFGALVLFLSALMGIVGIVIPRAIFSGAPGVLRILGRELPSALPLLFGTAFLFLGVEGFVCACFRFQSARAAALVRLVPAMIFFFLMTNLSEEESAMSAWQLRAVALLSTTAAPWLIGLAGILVFVALMLLAGWLNAKREM